ncbi:MAG: DEAD/DEAH box helicase [Victivallales bacterium]|nr:DEAD/DEAH box helicase [Victivallales bacterium]
MPDNPLSIFAPFIAEWFQSVHPQPTETQTRAWPVIAHGDNLLVTAPTGSGKTLTAFLWAINQLLRGRWPSKQLAAIYVSPLKALNNDIRENLLTPLAEIRELAASEGLNLPSPRIAVRSGDSTAAERRNIWTNRPEILITTPESLFLMLQSKREAVENLFSSVKTVIIDEVHALLNTRRGIQLAASLEWLAEFAGDFQRIALSATVKPAETAAAFVAGASARTPPPSPRPITIIECPNTRQLDVKVRLLPEPDMTIADDHAWKRVAQLVLPHLQTNHSTLIFCNARNTCEKISQNINDGQSNLLAFSHHGSLSKEIRQTVEKRMKAGELKAIVATSSLELGIDIGAIDEVVLVNAPSSIAAATQRIGRAGHRVGAASHALLLATHPHELLQAIAIRDAVVEKDIELSQPPQNCLDILAQIILAVSLHTPRKLDTLYNFITSIWSYRNLPRQHFDAVIQLLAGRYSNLSVTALRPRLNLSDDGTACQTRNDASTALKLSSGTIPDRGLYKLRQTADNALIGELDEEFVWEARIGQRFTLGTQAWGIDRITHDDVFVSPVPSTAEVPFWKAEPQDRPYGLSHRIADMLAQWDAVLEQKGTLLPYLINYNGMEPQDAVRLDEYLRAQKAATDILPNSRHIIIEHVQSHNEDGEELFQTVLHTFWGGRLNRPLSIAIRTTCCSDESMQDADIIAGNDAIWISAPKPITQAEIFSTITPENIEQLVLQGLQDSAFFAAHFREAAGRAILLPKGPPGKRKPLWMTRLRAQKLWNEIAQYPDFPIAVEAWRSCLQDEFDLPQLRRVLTQLQEGTVQITEINCETASPFAAQGNWTQVNTLMYASDRTPKPASPNSNWISDLIGTKALSIFVSLETIQTFEAKRQGTAAGYTPSSADELQNAIHDRWCMLLAEWTELANAIRRDSPDTADEILAVKTTTFKANGATFITDSTNIREIKDFPQDDTVLLASRLKQVFQYYGPIPLSDFTSRIPFPKDNVEAAIRHLEETGILLEGTFTDALPSPQICLRETLEHLARTERNARRLLDFKPIPSLQYQSWLAYNLCPPQDDGSQHEAFKQLLLKFTGLPLKLDSLETTFFPARFPNYDPLWLDSIAADGFLAVGSSDKTVRFVQESDLPYVQSPSAINPNWPDAPFTLDAFLREDDDSFDKIEKIHSDFLTAFLNGEITTDSFAPIRLLCMSATQKEAIPRQPRFSTSHRRHPATRANSRFNAIGRIPWRKIPWTYKTADPIETIEQEKERVRILIDRYGVLFKALMDREASEFSWRSLFPALRLLELSGEIVAGHFLNDVATLQFAAFDTLEDLKRHKPHGVIWFQANDPASLCGVATVFSTPPFPSARRESSFIVMQDGRIVLTATTSGKHILLSEDDLQNISPEWFIPWQCALSRRIAPRPSMEIQTVNGQPATAVIPRQTLETIFLVEKNINKWILYRK